MQNLGILHSPQQLYLLKIAVYCSLALQTHAPQEKV